MQPYTISHSSVFEICTFHTREFPRNKMGLAERIESLDASLSSCSQYTHIHTYIWLHEYIFIYFYEKPLNVFIQILFVRKKMVHNNINMTVKIVKRKHRNVALDHIR